MNEPQAGPPSGKTLVALAVPAIVIGIVSALVLWLLDETAHLLENWIWADLPRAVGFSSDSWWWILGVLTITGFAVGLVVWLAPGHGGHDSATVELVAPVLPLKALPGVAVVILLGLAGGVSLGPESPIIAINTALAVALLTKLAPAVPAELTLTIAAASTIGAMFGTPVAAALIFTGVLAAVRTGASLWDKLFLPLAGAGAGAVTTAVVGGPVMTLALPAYTPAPLDFLTGSIVALGGAGIAAAAAIVFPHVHRLFRTLRHPLLYITLGGVILGVLGIIGGPITLFKGLTQMGDLVAGVGTFTVLSLVVIIVVKLVALVVAASAGFRGGRIFPAVFIGVAVGMLGAQLIPGIPLGWAVACGVLGVVLVVGRDGWLALFMAVAVSGDIATLPMLCLVVLPTWLLARLAPEMIVHAESAASAPTR
jgi:H+/Cl- antiporter ClcA